MSAQHIMYKSILERLQQEEKDKAQKEAQKEAAKFQMKMEAAINKKKKFLEQQLKMKSNLAKT